MVMRLQTPMCGHLVQPPGRLVSHDLAIIIQASHKSFSRKMIKFVHAVGTALVGISRLNKVVAPVAPTASGLRPGGGAA
jgi:hypothetical protein